MAKPIEILRKPFAALAREWERMALRERRLVTALGAALVVGILAVAGFLFTGDLNEVALHNDDMREALKAIAQNRTEYLEARAKMRAQEVRIGTQAPQLQSDLEAAANEVGIKIPESNERPPTPVGRRYLEHNVDVKLRQVDLQQLGRFLTKLEAGQRLIYVTRLGLKRRFAERDKLDVELTATAVERLAKERPATRGPGRSKT